MKDLTANDVVTGTKVAVLTVIIVLCSFITTALYNVMLFRVLSAINADSMTWFIFWTYLPVLFLTMLITQHLTGLYSKKD